MPASVPLEIRFESIGGLGAHLAAQLLAETLALRQGFNVSQFSSYGSEKKGTPVRSFIRVVESDRPIRATSPVIQPDLLAVFHEALLDRPATLSGLRPGGALVVNASASFSFRFPKGRLFLVDAMTIAVEERTRINTAILGAVAKACPVIDAKALAAILEEQFGRKSPKLAESNVKTFWRGYQEAVERTVSDGPNVPPPDGSASPLWGYQTAPMGGAVLAPGSTIVIDQSASRQGFAPRLDLTRCNHCGLCDLVCPDYCLVWTERKEEEAEAADAPAPERRAARLLGIDYQYCKGCLRCVDSCPSGALTKEREGAWVHAERVPLRLEEKRV
jgi:pyruvate ferredoxin oxidoreductase gamma subunit